MKPNSRRLDPSIYPDHFDIPARFSDVDTQSHLNNVRLMEFYQEGRVMFHRGLESEFGIEPKSGTLVAHHSADYLHEVKYPGVIRLGIGVLKIGTSSYALGAALFQHDRCVGVSKTVVVNAGKTGAVPLPATLVAALNRKLLPADAQ